MKKYINLFKENRESKNVIGIAVAPKHKSHLENFEIPSDIILQKLDNVNYVGKIRTLITINDETKEKLEKIAKQENRSLNNLIETTLKDLLKERA